MKTNKPNKQAGWLDDRIEAYLDGELSADEQSRFEQLLEQDDAWQQEVSWALNIRDELRAVPTPDCPPHLEQVILRKVRKTAWNDFKTRFWAGISTVFVQWRPAIATVMLLVVASTIVFVINRNDVPPATPETISQAEVDQALAEAKWALGYVSKTGRLTGTSMQDALAPLLKEQTKE